MRHLEAGFLVLIPFFLRYSPAKLIKGDAGEVGPPDGPRDRNVIQEDIVTDTRVEGLDKNRRVLEGPPLVPKQNIRR